MSPVEQIVEWIEDKPTWWLHSIRLALRNGELSSKDLQEVYQAALIEYSIVTDDSFHENIKEEIDVSGYSAETDKINISSLSDVINVGVLAEEQTLVFPETGLTVIYGDNGAGKSSYAKILKHACFARGRKPVILGNVFETSDEPSSANISIMRNEVKEKLEWIKDKRSYTDLKSIRVFDTDSADHYVSDEDELGFKPSGINLIEELAKSINFVKDKVSNETGGSMGLVTLPEFSETKIGELVRSLDYKSDLSILKQYLPTTEEIESISSLEKDLIELKSKTPKQLREEFTDKIGTYAPLFEKLKQIVKELSLDSANKIKSALENYESKKRIALQLRDNLLSDLPIDNVAGESWKVMWDAAEKFFIENKPTKAFPPEIGEDCPLCLQEINSLSGKRLLKFKQFLSDQTAQEAEHAKVNWEKLTDVIKKIDLNFNAYIPTIEKINKDIDSFTLNLNKMIENLKQRKEELLKDSQPEKYKSIETGVVAELNEHIVDLNHQLRKIKDNNTLDEAVRLKENKLRLFKDKKLFKDNFEHIKNNLHRYKLLKKFEELEKNCNTRPVTDLNKKIYKKAVVLPLIKAFEEELKKFGFKRFRVKATTRGQNVSQLLKLKIDKCERFELKQIASEGERRCIAISCFLAELKADSRKSAVIFDDPVNSLSHQWSARVAERIVDESLHRQVIVLTHDIVFYKLLHEAVEKTDTAEIHEVCLERSKKRAGIVRSTPPWDALTTGKRIKYLKNVILRDLRKVDNEGTETEFRNKCYIFYGYLREAWERLVEEKLLNQVVTRFNRGVQTKRLSKLLDLSEEDLKKIEDGMAKCSTYFKGHDSAPAAGDPYPIIEELEADIKVIEEYNQELQNKRKRS